MKQCSALIEAAGFTRLHSHVLRHGRLSTMPLIRHGLVPCCLWKLIARVEASGGTATGAGTWGYADMLFESRA